MKRSISFMFGAMLLIASTAWSAPIVVTFNADALGVKPNGFMSADSNLVAFTDTVGANLDVENWGNQSQNSKALAVFGDDPSMLQMVFADVVTSLSLDFGNDDPGWAHAGDRAWLKVFLGATPVGVSSVPLNLNDLMDQTITFSGLLFDNALFYYGNDAGTPIGLIEIVDNVTFVPEPASLLLLAMGFAGVAAGGRRRW